MPESPQLPSFDRCHADALGGEVILDEGVIRSLLELGGPDGAELLLELIDLFIEDSVQRVSVLRVACSKGEPDSAVRAVHALKSASANIGAIALSRCCRELENEARGPGSLESIAARVQEMHGQVCECLSELRKCCSA